MLKISRKMSVNISMVLTVIFFFGIAICAFVMPDIADLFGQIADSYSLRGEVSPAEVTAVLVVGYIVIGFACAADVMILAAERIEHSARVFVNGTEAGILALRPYRLALDPALFRSGENRLELEVANTAANRYGAADPHAWFGAAEIGPYHDREQAEERKRKDGGLFGPVTLSPAVQKTGEGH